MSQLCYAGDTMTVLAVYPAEVPRPELWPVEDAAKEVGLGRATVFRYLADGALKRYRATVGRHKTLVDIHELRRLVRRPPGELAAESRPTPSTAAGARRASAIGGPADANASDGRPVFAAALIPHPGGEPKVLMGQPVWAAGREVWSWIGGHVREGESPEAALLRELSEELVLQGARIVRPMGVVDTHADASPWFGPRLAGGYVGHHYLVEIASPDVEVRDHEELTAVAWLTLDEIATALASFPEEIREADVRLAKEALAARAAAE